MEKDTRFFVSTRLSDDPIPVNEVGGQFYKCKSPLIHGMFSGDKIRKLFDSLCD